MKIDFQNLAIVPTGQRAWPKASDSAFSAFEDPGQRDGDQRDSGAETLVTKHTAPYMWFSRTPPASDSSFQRGIERGRLRRPRLERCGQGRRVLLLATQGEHPMIVLGLMFAIVFALVLSTPPSDDYDIDYDIEHNSRYE